MSADTELYEGVKGHHYEATVTPGGYGSCIKVDGVELPEVKSFRIEASVDGASLNVELLAFAKVEGIINQIRATGTAYLVANVAGDPICIVPSEAEARARISSGGVGWSYRIVPFEASL